MSVRKDVLCRNLPVERPMEQWPVFLMMSLRLFFRAKLTPRATWLAFSAKMAYGDRKPSRHSAGHPAGGPTPAHSLFAYLHPSTLSQSLFSVCPRLPPSNKSSRLTLSLPIPPLTNSQSPFQSRGNKFVDENGVLHHAGPKFGAKHVIRCPHCIDELLNDGGRRDSES